MANGKKPSAHDLLLFRELWHKAESAATWEDLLNVFTSFEVLWMVGALAALSATTIAFMKKFRKKK